MMLNEVTHVWLYFNKTNGYKMRSRQKDAVAQRKGHGETQQGTNHLHAPK